MKLAECNAYLVSTVATDGLVLKHQGVSNHSAENTLVHFKMFMGSACSGLTHNKKLTDIPTVFVQSWHQLMTKFISQIKQN